MDSYFKNRRSVRSFTDRAVGRETIEKIVEAAAKAPTTGNMQLYTVVATLEPENRCALAEAHFNQPAATGAKALLTVCADVNRFERWCRLEDADPGFRNLQAFFYAVFDAVVFAQQLVTVAEKEGLGTCYLGTTLFNAPEIAAQLHLPSGVVPLLTIAMGYPAGEGEETERMAVKGVLAFESYPQFGDEEIMEVYKPKDDYPANRRYIEENGKKTLAQVFTDIRYPRAMNEEFSVKLRDYLARNFFN